MIAFSITRGVDITAILAQLNTEVTSLETEVSRQVEVAAETKAVADELAEAFWNRQEPVNDLDLAISRLNLSIAPYTHDIELISTRSHLEVILRGMSRKAFS